MFEVRSGPDFEFQSPDYCQLFWRSNATAFQHPLWLDRIYRGRIRPMGEEPVIATVRTSRDGRLVAVLPLVRSRQYGLKILAFSDPKVSDYVGPICDSSAVAGLRASATLIRQIHDALPPFDLWRLQKLRADVECLGSLLGAVVQTPMPFSSHAVNLYAPAAAWRKDNIDRTALKELDQKARQLSRKGEVRLEIPTGPERIGEAFAAMRGFRKLRFHNREGEDLLQRPEHFDFYNEVACAGAGGFTRTYVLTVDGCPVAACFGLTHRREFLMLLMGFDMEAYKNQSVGLLLIDAVIRDCIERGDAVCDFTIGDEAYKTKFGAQPGALYEGWLAGSLGGSVALGLKTYLPWALAAAQGVLASGVRRRRAS